MIRPDYEEAARELVATWPPSPEEDLVWAGRLLASARRSAVTPITTVKRPRVPAQRRAAA